MSLTVRIDEQTHAVLKELAEKDRVSLQDELARVVEAGRRERFFAELQASFAQMTAEERAAYDAEAALWGQASGDGLEAAEDWAGFDAAPFGAP